MNKKIYETPIMVCVQIAATDVICTSQTAIELDELDLSKLTEC